MSMLTLTDLAPPPSIGLRLRHKMRSVHDGVALSVYLRGRRALGLKGKVGHGYIALLSTISLLPPPPRETIGEYDPKEGWPLS